MNAVLGWFTLRLHFPWTRRLAESRDLADRAQHAYERALARRPQVEAAANEMRNHRETNGWTRTIESILTGDDL